MGINIYKLPAGIQGLAVTQAGITEVPAKPPALPSSPAQSDTN